MNPGCSSVQGKCLKSVTYVISNPCYSKIGSMQFEVRACAAQICCSARGATHSCACPKWAPNVHSAAFTDELRPKVTAGTKTEDIADEEVAWHVFGTPCELGNFAQRL